MVFSSYRLTYSDYNSSQVKILCVGVFLSENYRPSERCRKTWVTLYCSKQVLGTRSSLDISTRSLVARHGHVSIFCQPIEARQRLSLVIVSMPSTLLYTGAVFWGWGPMQLPLEDHGFFAARCSPEEYENGEICPQQTSALLNVHFVAQTTQELE